MKQELYGLLNQLYNLVESDDSNGTSLIELDPKSDDFVKKIEEINELLYGCMSMLIDRMLVTKNNKFVRNSVSNVNYINSTLIELLTMRNGEDSDELRRAIHDKIDTIVYRFEYWD